MNILRTYCVRDIARLITESWDFPHDRWKAMRVEAHHRLVSLGDDPPLWHRRKIVLDIWSLIQGPLQKPWEAVARQVCIKTLRKIQAGMYFPPVPEDAIRKAQYWALIDEVL